MIIIEFLLLTIFQLYDKRVPSPYQPELDSETDLSNFDPIFTLEPVQLTPDDL